MLFWTILTLYDINVTEYHKLEAMTTTVDTGSRIHPCVTIAVVVLVIILPYTVYKGNDLTLFCLKSLDDFRVCFTLAFQ